MTVKELHRKEQKKQWFLKNADKVRKYQKERYQNNREERCRKQNEYNRKLRIEALALLGNQCLFCGTEQSLVFHEIDGMKHSTNTPYLVLNNPNNFALLCPPHHKAVHFCMDYLFMKWEEVINKWRKK